ncbi:MAG: hypothetical protein ACREIM_01300 [Nitrospiraceae bacterium]
MGLFIEDNSVVNGALAVMGILGALVLAIYSLTLTPPTSTYIEKPSPEKVKRIYTRHDLWR